MPKYLLTSLILISITSGIAAQPVIIGDFTEDALNSIRLNQAVTTRATTERSDTIDLLHFDIHLTVGNGTDQTIAGYSIVEFRSKMDNVPQLYLDLLKLNVDSVIQDSQKVTFDYSDSTTLIINLLNVLQEGDSSAVTVYYHGHPLNDETFGGVYFSGDYGFNVGMSLTEIPHNVGRMWHPCYDNFVERASYEFHITCDSARNALCNGSLIDSIHNSDGTITWHWKLEETVPTFIAGFAVAKFATINWTFSGLNGPVPVVLGCKASDTTKMKGSFGHLEDCFHIFEEHYGPYIWNKVGFNALPFDAGAMEHAGSIVYPQFACNGAYTYESLMAHELAHHWWGNAVTPYDATEIWLKEGWAVFSEFLFAEKEYDKETYDLQIGNNHEISVHYAHVFDGGYHPLSPMPLFTTFGRTTYTKSADIVHTLRSYMGDELFFGCLTSFVESHPFQNYKSSDLRDYLSDCSGIDLTSFFDDWVFATGFPHFSIDSFTSVPDGSGMSTISVHIRQKLNHAPHFYHNVPLEITFMNEKMETYKETAEASGPCTIYQTTLPFTPAFVCLDMNGKISDAITENFQVVKDIGLHVFALGKMNVTINTVGADSAFLRIEHNYVTPDPMINPIPNLHLSQERYWRVDGITPPGFDAKSNIYYNGTNIQPPVSYNGGYLDTKLMTNSEDSLVVMYRPDVASDWQIEPDVVFNYTGLHTDGKGFATVNHLKKGEYTFAIYQHDKVDSLISAIADSCFTIVSTGEISAEGEFTAYPNPSLNSFSITGNLASDGDVEIFNLLGERVFYQQLQKGNVNINIDSQPFGNGLFIVRISDNKHEVWLHKELLIGN